MKESYYHVTLDDNEHSAIIKSLNDSRNSRIAEGRPTDMYDDLIIKVANAPYRQLRKFGRNRDDAR